MGALITSVSCKRLAEQESVLQVCCEYLFDSVRPTAVLPCGHTIHSACLKELQRNRTSTCPICLKSYGNMDKVLHHNACCGLGAPVAL